MDYSNEDRGSGGKGLLIGIIIVLSLIAGVVAVFYFNIGGATNKFLIPTLNKVGLFNDLLPQTEDNPYDGYTVEELIEVIEDYKGQIDEMNVEISDKDLIIKDKDKEIERLKSFEEEQLVFKQEKENFDRMLIDNEYAPPVEAYIEFYRGMYPETAERVYKEAILQVKYSEDIKKYVKTYEEMDSESAAAILQQIVNTDMELVVIILDSMSADSRAKILEGMQTDIAARVSKNLAPVR